MAGEWRSQTFADLIGGKDNVIGGPFGSNLTQSDYTASGVPVIRGGNMERAGRYIGGDFVFVSEQKAQELAANQIGPGDIVITQRGTMGQVSIVPSYRYEKYIVSQSQMGIKTKCANALFIYYLMRSPPFLEFLNGAVIQTGVPHINMGLLRRWRISAPAPLEQARISSLLSVLDAKIEFNSSLAENLESIVRALFKSWFVDFDPTRAKADGRPTGLPSDITDLFPSQLVLGPRGYVPEGWEKKPLSQIVAQDRATIDPVTLGETLVEHFSLPAFDVDRRPSIEPASSIKSLKLSLGAPLVLFSKLNPETPRVWAILSQASRPMLASTEFVALRPASADVPLSFVEGLLASDPFREKASGMVTGTSRSHQRIQPAALLGTEWLMPPMPVLAAFAAVAGPVLARRALLGDESANLADLRDTLLPKLISGELRIADAERTVAAA